MRPGFGGGYSGGYSGGYGGYGGVGGGFGGSAGMGAMMGLSSMMGMYGLGSMGGPLSWLYSLNYFVSSLGIMYEWFGMNSHAILQLYHSTLGMIRRLVMIIRQSSFRRWLQQKSRKSAVVRFLFVVITMGIVSQAITLARFIYNEYKRYGAQRLLENGRAVAETLEQMNSRFAYPRNPFQQQSLG